MCVFNSSIAPVTAARRATLPSQPASQRLIGTDMRPMIAAAFTPTDETCRVPYFVFPEETARPARLLCPDTELLHICLIDA
jgi:hypothetical protein